MPYPKFIQDLEKSDLELFKVASSSADLAMRPGVLDLKTKMLIILALDAFAGSEGVKPVADMLRQMGVTEQEIKEALEIPYFVAGNKVLHARALAFE
jgi:alkylhydroperoxidase/carboxymuconolactone decarboxylase family protein YurZ